MRTQEQSACCAELVTDLLVPNAQDIVNIRQEPAQQEAWTTSGRFDTADCSLNRTIYIRRRQQKAKSLP